MKWAGLNKTLAPQVLSMAFHEPEAIADFERGSANASGSSSFHSTTNRFVSQRMPSILETQVAVERPTRWDHPLDPEMLTRDLAWILGQPPFSKMNSDVFPSHSPLEDVLKNDCRILRFEPGDVVIREGDYGGSAYLVLRGSVRAFLESLWQDRGKPVPAPFRNRWARWFSKLGLLRPASSQDRRTRNRASSLQANHGSTPVAPSQRIEQSDGTNRIFLQDISAVIEGHLSESLGIGEIFGEMAAITRSQHRYTVVADSPAVVLEVRWQGLRMMRRDRGFREYLDERYRATSLQTHLRETPLFRFLDDEAMERVIQATKIESHGDMEWFADYRDVQKLDVQKQIEREPLIAQEGRSADDLILIRAGFARLSFRRGGGHQTMAYLGRGQSFGLQELTHRFRHPSAPSLPYQASLRALGFVDLLRIPSDIVLSHVLPKVRDRELPKSILNPRYDQGGLVVREQASVSAPSSLETPLVEFLVDERLINGTQAMVIDLDRCTRCDDCVKACADTHDGTPRFVRNGPQHGPLLFAHACMHCVDPVCMIGCPTGAIARDQDSGVISIDPNSCIGCQVCAESCPYDNIVMVQAKDRQGRAAIDQQTRLPILQATKCDMCHHLANGPACVSACPHDALSRINLSDADSLPAWFSGGRR